MTERNREIPQDVQAIVLDTNSGSNGFLNLEQIRELVDVINAQELVVEIWIPEPALWEWAEHAHNLALTTKKTTEAAARRLDASGVEGFAEVAYTWSIAELVEHLEEKVTDFWLDDGRQAVVVLDLGNHAEAAVAGIRDQVLKLGAGRTKSDKGQAVKTGASDSASWRLVEAAADSLGRVVLVTADRDADQHFADGDAPVLLKDIWAAKEALLRLQNGSELAFDLVDQAIREDLPRLSERQLHRATVAGGLPPGLLPRRDSNYDPVVRVLGIDRVVNVDDIEVSRRDETATALALVELRVSVDFLRWDPDSESLESDTVEESGVEALAQVSAESGGIQNRDWSAWVSQLDLRA
ncbi:hypothetical protein [Microbacterium sp. Root166]|uniref:hypothetical protein n=1 Tax=Microbacterium sp. Root166 TaxID=1736478 RepID=UPI000B1823C9|nr:hypothetical protein [Microbacterium sp. Root166]